MKLLTTYCKENPEDYEKPLTGFIYLDRRYNVNSGRHRSRLRCSGVLINNIEHWMKINHYKVRTKCN